MYSNAGASMSPELKDEDEEYEYEASASRSPSPPPKASLEFMRHTRISKGNDALDMLLTAATQNPPEVHPSATLKLYSNCRFVREGWLSAQEAVTLVDKFFQNLCPLSPVISDYYAKHANHRQLLTKDAVLCCTIMAISSRYHPLPGLGSRERSTVLHENLSKFCEELLSKMVFSREAGRRPHTRTIGTIEALLLLTEWHPRSLHFPPSGPGWDPAVLLMDGSVAGHSPKIRPADSEGQVYHDDVSEPAKRSDRLSWMLVGNAVSLAHELGIFRLDAQASEDSFRRLRIRKLLYVYVNHLAQRIGCMTLLPDSLNLIISRNMHPEDQQQEQWQSHMTSWIDLTKLSREIGATFFSSKHRVTDIIRNGQYVEQVRKTYQPKLEAWQKTHLESRSYTGSYHETLSIEYHYVRMYMNSLGMQAACERYKETGSPSREPGAFTTYTEGDERVFTDNVIESCCEILNMVLKLSRDGTLRYAPVRLFLRVTTVNVFLLKALVLGVQQPNLQRALDALEQIVQALRNSDIDEIHLIVRYAELLERHIGLLKQGFLANLQQNAATNEDNAPQTMTPVSNNVAEFDLYNQPSNTTYTLPPAWMDYQSMQPFPDDGNGFGLGSGWGNNVDFFNHFAYQWDEAQL